MSGIVHSLLKWQQPNIPAAVCVYNINQTKDKEQSLNSLNIFCNFNKYLNIFHGWLKFFIGRCGKKKKF